MFVPCTCPIGTGRGCRNVRKRARKLCKPVLAQPSSSNRSLNMANCCASTQPIEPEPMERLLHVDPCGVGLSVPSSVQVMHCGM
jgi:hypothetical protein